MFSSIMKPDIWTNYVQFDRKSFNLDFDTLLSKIKQKLTVLWELENQNAPNLETRWPIQF